MALLLVHHATSGEKTLMKNNKEHVVVIGGGFGGLSAVRAMRGMDVQVTLIDRNSSRQKQYYGPPV